MHHPWIRGKLPWHFAIRFMLAAWACCAGTAMAQQSPLLASIGPSLIKRAQAQLGGLAWQSVIQAPNYQTDRDVGAASVGTGLLQMYDATGNASYLNAAEQAGDWLIAAQTAAGWWPDYDNPRGGAARYGFTSLDDGAAGQASFLFDLYQKSGDARYQAAAINGFNWLLSQARAPGRSACPAQQCYWTWHASGQGQVYLGVGSGVAGIFYRLDRIAQLTGNALYERYALAGAAYEETQIAASGAVPEAPGGGVADDTGLYQGGAGVALAYYSLYLHTRDTRWLNDANKIMAWVRSRAIAKNGGMAWPISTGTHANPVLSTEMAEGAAGIGWAELQAYKVTHAAIDLQAANAAAGWLLSVATVQVHGVAWPAYMSGPLANDYYTAEDLGTAGIGYFFDDLYQMTSNAAYLTAAQNAAAWLQSVSVQDAKGAGWYEHNCIGCGGWSNYAEPSFNWGMAGIGAFAARLAGGADDMPRDIEAFAGER